MQNTMNSGGTIRELENLTNGIFNVEEFRKSLLAARTAKVIPFPDRSLEISPLGVAALKTPFDAMFAPLPSFLKDDAEIVKSFPALSELQCECEDCACTEHPSNWVETRWANFKLCSQCLDGCAKHVEKVVDFEAMSDEQLCNDWELRR